jgi:hypothetical protein
MGDELERESTPPGDANVRWLDRGRTAIAAVWPWLVPAAVVLLLRIAHQVPSPPRLAPEQLRVLAAIARQELERPTPEPNEALPTVGESVTAPVFVTVYGDQPTTRAEPVVGRWEPRDDRLAAPIEDAVRHAAHAAAAQLEAQGRSTTHLTIKVDVAGPSRRLWVRLPGASGFLFNPGRDGWHGWRGTNHGYRLPSWAVEREESATAAIAALRAQLGGAPAVGRFRTLSFVQLPGKNEPSPVYRGNVLIDDVTTERVTESLRAAGEYLTRSIRDDGSYCYEYLPRDDRCSNNYNLLRHAGTTYSLFQIHRRLPNPRFAAAAERATNWLRQRTRPVRDDAARVFLLEGRKAKLGAAGLTLIALVERERAVGDGKDRELMTKLADFIISQQRDDGYFASFFDWGPEAEVPSHNSIYYPGEALLGLIRLYELDAQPRFLAAAQLGTEFLVKHRWRWGGVEVQVPPDAWLTQAVAELDTIAPEPWLRDYAYEIVRGTDQTMLRAEEGTEPDFVGGPSGGLALPRVTPAGSRSEGLTAAWRMANNRGQRDRARWLKRASLRAARFQLNQQYREENSFYLPRPTRVLGGFRETPVDPMVRIDTVQHNATGLLGVLEILTEGSP